MIHVRAAASAEAAAHVDGGPGLSRDTAERLCCDAVSTDVVDQPDGSPLDLGRRRRRPGQRLLRALWLRDRGCRFPGCGRRVWVHAHHLWHWMHGGRTDLANLVLLCGTHHRLLHEDGYLIAVEPDGGFRFLRPDGSDVLEAPPLHGDPWAAVAGHTAVILPDTVVPNWYGERLDLQEAVSAVLAADAAPAAA